MHDTQPSPVRGLVAGKYEIGRLIGRGGMGSVWEGHHTSLGTRVAIKFIDQEHAASHEVQSRFATEARAAATIQSKHAIQIFDHGVTGDGRPYIVMELLSGEALDKRIARLGRMSLQDTARILGQVVRARQRAHDAGIIHRDLKPENIFLVRSPDDDDEIAKVLDFGIAKIRAPPDGVGISNSTKTGVILGTPYYMSPEQARGLRSIDHRSDLWSLGVIAYKCVTGVLPFDGESVGDLLVKICTAPPPVPSRIVPGLPSAFDAWFARVLEREPSMRFSSASELGEELASAAGLSALALTSAPFVAPMREAGSSRGIALAVAVAALVGGSIGVVAVARTMPDKGKGAAPAAATNALLVAPATVTKTFTTTTTSTSSATTTSTPTATSAPPIPSHPVRPAGSSPKGTAAPVAPAKPSPAKSTSTSADPGY